MKRLFYLATDLDDVALIIHKMESEGISDKQFFVISRNEYALRRRFLHGGRTLDNTKIVAAGSRSNIFGLLALCIYIGLAIVALPLHELFATTVFVIGLMVFVFVKLAVLVAGGMYDDYFKGVFNNNLDYGNSIVVVDVNARQSGFVFTLFEQYPTTCLLVDASNFASPMPMKKYIRRDLPKLVK